MQQFYREKKQTNNQDHLKKISFFFAELFLFSLPTGAFHFRQHFFFVIFFSDTKIQTHNT